MDVLEMTRCAYCGEPAVAVATVQVAPKLEHVPREIGLPVPVCAHCRPSFPHDLPEVQDTEAEARRAVQESQHHRGVV